MSKEINEKLRLSLIAAFEELRPICSWQEEYKKYEPLMQKYNKLKKGNYSSADLAFRLSVFAKELDKYKNSVKPFYK